jgi:hypothetical protein
MTPDPDKIKLFHITSYNNLRSIVFEHEALLCKLAMMQRQVGHIDIAYESVQSRRVETLIPHPPYGNLHDYVPFSFCPRPVMLLPIKSGRVPQYQNGQDEIVHLVSDFPMVSQLSLPWVFTDGHAIMGLTDFCNNPNDFNKVDWEIVGSNDWADTLEDNDRKRRKQAEFLVYDSFPWIGIKWIVTISEEIKTQVENVLQEATHKPKIIVKRNFYY